MYRLFSWTLHNFKITALLVALLTLFGVYSMYVMPKDEFPPYVIRQGVVIAVNPGATSEEIEAQVARPLERYLFTYSEVERSKTTTTSMNGLCLVMVVLKDEVMNKDEVWSKIKHGLNAFKQQLPSSVLALMANDDFGDTSALLISIESEQRSYRELQQYSDELADRLRCIGTVSNVRQYGNISEQISLYVDRDRLAAYGIGQNQIAQALNAQGLTTMAGQISTQQNNFAFHIAPTQNSEEEIAQQIVYTDPKGKVVRVRDVARVVREYDTSSSYIEQNGHKCVLLSLEMTSGNNIVQYGKDVDKVLDAFRATSLPKDVKMSRITDLPQVVGDSVSDFLVNLLESMLVIFLVMLILFPWRSAVVSAAVVPISTFVSVGLMYLVGMPLNLMSLACLIVVLGMIVDNSIVVIDGYLEYLGKGMERHAAAIESVKQYFMPMFLATICICAIFYPIVYTLKGAPGDVVQVFPLCITINLMVSLFLAVCVMPALEVNLIKKAVSGRKAKGKKNITDYVQAVYDKLLRWNFRHPWLTLLAAVVLIGVGGAIFPHLKMRQFPYADRNQFAVEIYLPEGSGLDETRAVADGVRDLLMRDKRVTTVTSFVGCASPRFHVAYAPQMGGPNYAQLIVNTPDIETTGHVLDDYTDKYADHWPNAYVRFKQIDYLDVPTYEYRFVGENLDSLHAAADALMAQMRAVPELVNVHTDYEIPHPIVDINLDPVASAQLGVNRTTAALQLAALSGDVKAGSIWEDNYELPIVLRSEPARALSTVDDVKNVFLGPKATPLRQVAEVAPKWTETKIIHRGGERTISVAADGRRGVLALPIQKRLIAHLDTMPLPQGVRAVVGGETERNTDMMPQIVMGLSISLIIIFFFILFSFKRFDITFLSIVAMGLGVPGAMIGLYYADRVLGLTSLFGFVTLMGIIMRNEILIFEHADAKVAEGMSVRDAAFDAGRRRMVPIFLTTATTAVGVIPMIIDESSFWTPVGITIFSGGIGTLLLVVTVLPVAYWKLYGRRDKKRSSHTSPSPVKALIVLLCACCASLSSFAIVSPEQQSKGLDGLTLDQCQEMALHNNRSLQKARLDVRMADEDAEVAFTKFFPSLQAGVTGFIGAKDLMRTTMDMTGFGQTYGPALMQAGLGELLMSMPPQNDVSMMKKGVVANAVAMQPLYAGGQIVTGNRLAALQKEVRRLQCQLSEKDVLLNVAEYYWQIVALRSNLLTLDAVDTQLAAIRELTENYVKAGIIVRNDLLTVELKQQEMASARLQLNNGIELLRLVLAQLCGADDVETFCVASPADISSPLPPDHYFLPPSEAVYSREELDLAGKNVEAKALDVKMERGKCLPSVAIGAAGLYQGIDMGEMSVKNGGSMYNMNIGNLVGLATVSIPISDWWGGRHAIRKARIAQEQAENDRLDALERLQIDIISAWNNLTEAYAQIAISRKSVESSTENLRLCREQYAAGTEPISVLLDAVTLFTRANNDLNANLATYQSRVSEYLRKTR